MQEIVFNGYEKRVQDNRIPFEAALLARNCILDEDTVNGRPGTRRVLTSAIVSTGTVQHFGRFRPSATSARTIEVIAGEVWVIEDPTTVTASDGTKTSKGTMTGFTTGKVSGAQLGSNYYLGSDQVDANGKPLPLRRIWWNSTNDSYTLETLTSIDKGGKPGGSGATPVWAVYGTTVPDASITVSGGTATADTSPGWIVFTPAALGDALTVQLPLARDMSTADWLCIGVSPYDNGGSTVEVHFAEDSGGSPGTYIKIGDTHDVPPFPGSPNILFCDLRSIPTADRNAIKWVKFVAGGTIVKPSIAYGHLLLNTKPINNPEIYVVTFRNTNTGDESRPTDPLEVVVTGGILPVYKNRFYANGVVTGASNTSPIATGNRLIYNREAGKAMPSESEIGQIITITGIAPLFTTPPTVLARLWKLAGGEYRLVTTATVASGAAYSFVDYGGDTVLAAQRIPSTGTAPRMNALGANPQRLIALYENRVYISSYIPTSATQPNPTASTSNPYPQWPDIALEDADGWSFDIAPGPTELGMVCNGQGDAVYIVTTEACYAMTDLTPNSLPFLVLRKGTSSRFAAGYWEDRFFWGAYDGIYMASGKSHWEEWTKPVRRLYQDTLIPDANLCLGYHSGERAIYAFQDTRYMRFYFPNQRWTDGTYPANVRMALGWTTNGIEFWLATDTWFIGRWQKTATRDLMTGTDTTTGTAIPDWIYSTGFQRTPQPAICKGMLVDADGEVKVTIASTVDGIESSEARSSIVVPRGDEDEVWNPSAADFKAYKHRVRFDASNIVELRYAEWGREIINAR